MECKGKIYETIDVAIEMGGGQAGAYARFVLKAMQYYKAKEILGDKFRFHAADPTDYISGLDLKSRRIDGVNFNAFLFRKNDTT